MILRVRPGGQQWTSVRAEQTTTDTVGVRGVGGRSSKSKRSLALVWRKGRNIEKARAMIGKAGWLWIVDVILVFGVAAKLAAI